MTQTNFLKKWHLQAISILFFGGILLVAACEGDKKLAVKPAPEVTPYPVAIARFDKDLLKADPNHPELLEQSYPYFYKSYLEDLLALGPKDDPRTRQQLNRIISGRGYQELNQDVNNAFPDLTSQEEELGRALGYFRHYFPESRPPRFVAFISEFGYSCPFFDSVIGVGLDFYLGADYKYYPSMDFPDYMIRKLRREYMVPDLVKALGLWQFDVPSKDNRFLSEMIKEGKLLYYATLMQPHTADTLVTGWSKVQIDWCRENEDAIWAHFIDQQLLYNTDKNLYLRYLTDAPYTVAKGVPANSAPRIGAYMGWRIVEEYAKKTGKSLKQIMEEQDAQQILQSSQYKPKK